PGFPGTGHGHGGCISQSCAGRRGQGQRRTGISRVPPRRLCRLPCWPGPQPYRSRIPRRGPAQRAISPSHPLPSRRMSTPSRVALGTGSTSGIGAAIARRLANQGYAIVLHSRSSVDAGHALASELGSAAYVQADLANEDDRERLVSKAIAVWGQLDVLVNNAGISRTIPHADLSAATSDIWQELHEVNVVAPFRLVAHAQAALRDAAKR